MKALLRLPPYRPCSMCLETLSSIYLKVSLNGKAAVGILNQFNIGQYAPWAF